MKGNLTLCANPSEQRTEIDWASWQAKLWRTKVCTRVLLAGVWLIEGFYPKLINVAPREIALVERSGLYFHSAEATLALLGVVEIIAGILLLLGYKERATAMAVTLATVAFSIIVPLNDPEALWDPFGGVVKNLALFACGIVLWTLSPIQRLKHENRD